ncbi:MAG TPA: rod shape-determining protein RodA [Coxiellaceae bacterium]|nr:rod shape-determining protein RodA [Coxiellaceae bacterium]
MPTEFFKRKLQRKESGTQYRTIFQVLHLDLYLLLGILMLVVFGFFILYSASNQNLSMVIQAILHIGLAALIMFVFAQIPPYFYERWSTWVFGLGSFLLLIVLAIGKIKKGAQRWLNLGGIHLQPSEVMKIAIPMMLAGYLAHKDLPPRLKDMLMCALIILVPALLTMKQPDLGTGILLVLTGFSVLFLAGMRWRYLLGILLGVGALMPILGHVLHGYQKQRILTFLNPERDPLGAGYHIIQSKIAIGSGGFLGKGWLHGTQSHLSFLPEHATDFIFAVCGEEFGFIGGLFLLLIYLYITACCFRIAYQAQDTYTRLLAGGLSFMFFMSVFVNMGMVVGILPVVGVPLPLISYGGSSMITLMATFGILMSIQCHRKLIGN